jgi:hypothetical protein
MKRLIVNLSVVVILVAVLVLLACQRVDADQAAMVGGNEPEVASLPDGCHRYDVTFLRRQRVVTIEPFTWGVTYPVAVVNASPQCAYTARLEWKAYNSDSLVMSGGCCYFSIGPLGRLDLPFAVPGLGFGEVTRCEVRVYVNSGAESGRRKRTK